MPSIDYITVFGNWIANFFHAHPTVLGLYATCYILASSIATTIIKQYPTYAGRPHRAQVALNICNLFQVNINELVKVYLLTDSTIDHCTECEYYRIKKGNTP